MAMAQQLAQDPAFMEMTQQLQQQMGGLMGGAPGGGPPAMPGGAPGGGPPAMPNPEQYMEMMQGMMNNPAVMQMSQRMFEQMQGEPAMARMMSAMSDPASRNELESKIKTLRDEDPELAGVIDEIEKGGPQAMMKYWSDPDVLSKLGKGMEKVLEEHLGGEAAGAGAAEAEAEEDEEVIVNYAWEAAQLGDPDALRELLDQEADKDEVDDEGRSGLHFACGYGELECAQVLIDAKANLNVTDAKDNTPLHYAAGYGQLEPVKMLIDAGADTALKNKDGHTAHEIAEMNAQEEIMKLLVAK